MFYVIKIKNGQRTRSSVVHDADVAREIARRFAQRDTTATYEIAPEIAASALPIWKLE